MTPDQQSLVDLARQVLRGRTSSEQLAAVETSTTRFDERLWAELGAAGLLGIAIPEDFGGAGLGLSELCLLLEEHGRGLALVPMLENAVAALALSRFGTDEQRKRWLPGAADGTAPLTLAVDLTSAPAKSSTALLPFAQVAAAALVSDGDAMWLLDLSDLDGLPVPLTTHALAVDVAVTSASAERVEADAGWVRDVLRAALAAGQLGNADAGVREAASYVSEREQFGRPLATFQAVSQQLADCYCDVQAMRATLWQAVWKLESGEPARREVDVAAWWATDAGVRVTTVVQHVHGGIGADTTYPIHRRLLRALQTDALLGGASRQLARLGAELV